MPAKFTIEFDRNNGLWCARSKQLNLYVVHRDLKAICNDIPNVVALVDRRWDDELVKSEVTTPPLNSQD